MLANVLTQLEHATPPKTHLSANTQFIDIVSHILWLTRAYFWNIRNSNISICQVFKACSTANESLKTQSFCQNCIRAALRFDASKFGNQSQRFCIREQATTHPDHLLPSSSNPTCCGENFRNRSKKAGESFHRTSNPAYPRFH